MAGHGHFEARLTHWGDILALVLYFVATMTVGIWSMCRPGRKNIKGYFLAGRSISWWPVGLSVFASNISSEHFIGMAGAASASGIAVILFEWHAIFLIILMTWIFLPVYMASRVYTLPEYIMKRFNSQRLRLVVSLVFLLQTCNCIMPVDLYSGGLFIQQSLGWDLYYGVLALIAISLLYSILGGLATVMYTDSIQVVIMIGGAWVVAVLAMIRVGGLGALRDRYGDAMADVVRNNSNLTCGRPREDAWHLFRDPVNGDYPWVGTLLRVNFGGIAFWCATQTIVQRSLAARNLSHAKGGALLACVLKFTPIFIMVIPGMISRVLFPNEVACADPETCMAVCGSSAGCSNIAYPRLVLEIVPIGLRGLVMAVMLSAVVSSLTSMYNSVGTVITLDLWVRCRPNASTREQLIIGKVSVLLAAVLPVVWMPVLHNAEGGQVYLYLTYVTGYLASPLSFMFLLAMLWPRTNEQGAFWGFTVAVCLGLLRFTLDVVYPRAGCGAVDDRPAVLAMVHPYYYITLQLGVGTALTVVISLLTTPIPRQQLVGLTFWTYRTVSEPEDTKVCLSKLTQDTEDVADTYNAENNMLSESDDRRETQGEERVTVWRRLLTLTQDVCGVSARGDPDQSKTEEELSREVRDRLTERPAVRVLLNVLAGLSIALAIGLYIYFR